MDWKERIREFASKITRKQPDSFFDTPSDLGVNPNFHAYLPVLQPGYLRGRALVKAAGGLDLLVRMAREIRERDETNTAYVQEQTDQWHHYQIDLRWDLRLSELDYAFSDHESKKVSIMGGYQVWGANGGVEVYYYVPRRGDPNQTDPVNADAELCQIASSLPKPLSEYNLEERVGYAMSRTNYRIDFLYGIEVARMDRRAQDILEGQL